MAETTPPSQPWEPDAVLSEDQAAARIDRRFPDLAPARLERLGVGFGFDNDAWLVNDAWVFRFPRRDFAVQFMRTETTILPRLAPRLPVPIPSPEFKGEPDEHYPYPWAGYRFLAGRSACGVPLDDDGRVALARPLGEFLRALHAEDPGEYPDLPGDVIRRVDLPYRMSRVRQALSEPTQTRAGVDSGVIERRMEELSSTAARTGPSCIVHGDLYARHLLLEEGRLAGIVDWGDVHLGDPALDLSIAYSFLPPQARDAFFEAYGETDATARDRARFRGIFYGIVLVDYGASVGDADLEGVGRVALRFALA